MSIVTRILQLEAGIKASVQTPSQTIRYDEAVKARQASLDAGKSPQATDAIYAMALSQIVFPHSKVL